MTSEEISRRKSPVKALLDFGQSPWLDFIQRGLLNDGELERMITDWGLRGLTSNWKTSESILTPQRRPCCARASISS